ncbi:MAG: PLP-dependent aminotransferase family protein, partial [Candidatus Obscuribacterales bacterium]|nr:PLP-dependent aminotransferase family protein [Candidatus Obscuribacterales bacterium]
IDGAGLEVESLFKLEVPVKLICVAPSHHKPTGEALSMSRRKKLLYWADENEVYVVEDDYESEYRYTGRPLPALQGMDTADRVFHLSCFWRVLWPEVRLGFLVVPRCLKDLMRVAKIFGERDLPLVDQLALTDFINEGHLERYISQARRLFKRRRETIVNILAVELGSVIEFGAANAATNLLIRLRPPASDNGVIVAARKAGLELISTAPYYSDEAKEGEYILPLSNIKDEDIENAVRLFASELMN